MGYVCSSDYEDGLFPSSYNGFKLGDIEVEKPDLGDEGKQKKQQEQSGGELIFKMISSRKRTFDQYLKDTGHSKSMPKPTKEGNPNQEALEYLDSKRAPLKIKTDKRLPVKSFLSRPGKRDHLVRYGGEQVSVKSLVGKHLLICCFVVPMPANHPDTDICRAMIAAYPKLREENFEMVMVAKMKNGFSDDEESFSCFFSAFPCLAVPWEDSDSRDFICRSLGLTLSSDVMSCLVVNDKQVVLRKDAGCFLDYGADSFPFTAVRLNDLAREDEELKVRLDPIYREVNRSLMGILSEDEIDQASLNPVSLGELLGCQPCDILCKSSGDDKVSVSELSTKKCICLYLCYDGLLMDDLFQLQQKCLASDFEFEVVLVFLPFCGDFDSFIADVKLALERRKIFWWILPFDDAISRRLWRLVDLALHDRLIILDTASQAGELNGKAVIQNFGIEVYPFTRKGIVDEKVSALKSLTLESLLGSSEDGYNYVCRSKGPPFGFRVSELKGRNILLYFDYPDFNHGDLFKLLRKSYDQIKQVHHNAEVVYVPLKEDVFLSTSSSKMPWLTLPIVNAGSVTKQLFLEGEAKCRTLIAFGDDGLICSRRAQKQLTSDGDIKSLFADNLREEIIDALEDIFEGIEL